MEVFHVEGRYLQAIKYFLKLRSKELLRKYLIDKPCTKYLRADRENCQEINLQSVDHQCIVVGYLHKLIVIIHKG